MTEMPLDQVAKQNEEMKSETELDAWTYQKSIHIKIAAKK